MQLLAAEIMHRSFAAKTAAHDDRFGFVFSYAAARWRYRHFRALLFGRNLSLGDRHNEARCSQRNLPDERSAVHVWTRIGRTVHGAACRQRLGSRRLGIIPPAQLGALGRDARVIHWNRMAGAEDFRCGVMRTAAVVRTADRAP